MKTLVNGRMALGVMAVCAGCLPEVTFRYACAGDAACDDARDVSSGETDITVPTDGTLGDGATDGSDAAADVSATDANVADAADVSPADATDVSATDAADASATDASVMDASATDATDVGAADVGAADVGAADVLDVPDVPRCGAGMVLRAGVCVAVPAARALAPLSGSQATHRRPIVEWVNGEGVDGARVEFCRDRACTMVLATITAVGEQGLPLTELPPGPVWWRVWARSGAVEATTPSAAWLVHVPQRSSGVNTFTRAPMDFNGDGYADIAVGITASSEVRVYFGSASGIGATPDRTVRGVSGAAFGAVLEAVGDVDGDARTDLLITERSGQVHLLTGAALVRNESPVAIARDGAAAASYVMHGLGDLNGDGLAELGAITNVTTGGAASLRIYLGSATAPIAPLPRAITRDSGGLSVAPTVGDYDRDGYGDLFVGSLQPGTNTVELLAGDANALQSTPRSMLRSTVSAGALTYAIGGFDLQGARRSAIVAGLILGRDVLTYYNPPIAGVATPFVMQPAGVTTFSGGIAAGDFDGDGRTDLAIATDSAPRTIRVSVGTMAGLGAAGGAVVQGQFKWAVPGDLNGDGYADLVAAEATATELCPSVHYGGASGVATASTRLLCRPTGEDVTFAN